MPRDRSDNSPKPPESEASATDPDSPLFLTPDETPPPPSPSPEPPSSSPSPSPAGDGFPGSASGTRSTGNPLGRGSRLREFRNIARGVVLTAGSYANQLLARSEPELERGVWLPDDDDVREISEPLAGIASRRVPAGAADNPDAADIARLAFGLVGYVAKSLQARARIRKAYGLDAGSRDTETPAGDRADDQTPDPARLPGDDADDLTPGRSFLSGRFGGLDAGPVPAESPDAAQAG